MIPIKTIHIHHRLCVHRIGNREFSLPLPQCIDVGRAKNSTKYGTMKTASYSPAHATLQALYSGIATEC